MKKAINLEGFEQLVSDDTLVRTVNGVHYLLTPEQTAEYDARVTARESEKNDPQAAKDKVIAALNEYADSDAVRGVTYMNHTVYANKKARDGTTELRARLRDNGDVTTCDWFFDDGAIETLDLNDITTLNKLVVDKDQAIRQLKYNHKQAILALNTVNEVNAYDFKAAINGNDWV